MDDSYQIDFIHRAPPALSNVEGLAVSSASSGVHEYASSLTPCRRALWRTQSGITLFLTANWYHISCSDSIFLNPEPCLGEVVIPNEGRDLRNQERTERFLATLEMTNLVVPALSTPNSEACPGISISHQSSAGFGSIYHPPFPVSFFPFTSHVFHCTLSVSRLAVHVSRHRYLARRFRYCKRKRSNGQSVVERAYSMFRSAQFFSYQPRNSPKTRR